MIGDAVPIASAAHRSPHVNNVRRGGEFWRLAPACACPSCAHTRHLPACALPMPARALCLCVFAMFVFLADSPRAGYSDAERHSNGEGVECSTYTPTKTPGSFGNSSGVILRVIRTHTLCSPVSCFCLHVPCPVLLSVFHSFLLSQRDKYAHIQTHTDTHEQTHIRRHTPKDTTKDTPTYHVAHTYTHTHIQTK